MRNLEGINITEVPETKIEKKSISEVSYEDADNFDDCYKVKNGNQEELETFDDCYKEKNDEKDEVETFEDCRKDNGITLEFLINYRNRLQDLKNRIPKEALDGKYTDSNVEDYRSRVSMFINLGKMYFGINEKIELEDLYDLIDEEQKQKNK